MQQGQRRSRRLHKVQCYLQYKAAKKMEICYYNSSNTTQNAHHRRRRRRLPHGRFPHKCPCQGLLLQHAQQQNPSKPKANPSLCLGRSHLRPVVASILQHCGGGWSGHLGGGRRPWRNHGGGVTGSPDSSGGCSVMTVLLTGPNQSGCSKPDWVSRPNCSKPKRGSR